MTDTDWLAKTHAASFADRRPWSAQEFASLLGSGGVFLTTKPGGFALTRTVLDDAEILTIAVLPGARQRGVGSAILAELEATARQRKVARIFLEVAEDNLGALALYYGNGYRETGRRSGYYAGFAAKVGPGLELATGPDLATGMQDALILSKSLI